MKYTAYFVTAAVIIVIAIPFIILTVFSSPSDATKNISGDSLNDLTMSNTQISVYRESSGTTIELPLEEYVAGVIASEVPASFELEALKAQAVVARTYGLARQGNLCDTVHCQVFKTEDEIRKEKGDEWMNSYWDKIVTAAESTAGQVIYYNGELAGQVLFHSSSGGRTENSEDVFVSAVPYLRSVDSPYEEEATHKGDETRFTLANFVRVINSQYAVEAVTEDDVKSMKITKKSTGGRVAAIKIGNNEFTGKRMREMFKLPSANFTYKIDGDEIVITTNGYGHGVGMSQYGANGMAKEGYKYDDILKHYYSGVEIKEYEPESTDNAGDQGDQADQADQADQSQPEKDAA